VIAVNGRNYSVVSVAEKVPRRDQIESTSGRLPIDGNTASTNSTKNPMTNQPTPAHFQIFANGIRLALNHCGSDPSLGDIHE
jgi:hypothetical protein